MKASINFRSLPEPSTCRLRGPNENPKFDIVWKEIFLRCQFKDLSALRKVCRQFYRTIDNNFWMNLCMRNQIALPPKNVINFAREHGHEFDFWFLYGKAIKSKMNPYGKDFINGFNVEDSNEWTPGVEEAYSCTAYACLRETLPRNDQQGEDMPRKYLQLRCIDAFRSQYFKFKAAGIEDWVLDFLRPKLVIKELAASTFDCPAAYQLAIKIGKAVYDDDEEDLGSREVVKTIRLEKNSCWTEVELALEKYPFGMREALIKDEAILMEGQTYDETSFLEGMRLADLVVRIEFPDPLHWYDGDEAQIKTSNDSG